MGKIFGALILTLDILILWPPFVFGRNARGSMEMFQEFRRIFVNTDCEKNDTCDLKEFALTFERYKMKVAGGDVYGVTTAFEYETTAVPFLENYLIVQFMRGCEFDYYFAPDTRGQKYFGYVLMHFGENKYFCFPDWVIDSSDTDPAYGSDKEFGRFATYRWNRTPGSVDRKTEVWYVYEKPIYPRIYAMESKLAFASETSAKNVSLEFKTCIYKKKDVPLKTMDNNINFALPIHCFSWNASHIYNYETKEFEAKSELDPFCLQKPPPY